ncbi:MAG: DUF4259 domain-containing protein [Ardenticatenaceae bacterium]|nr:DUF4259 domain-containing protein [Ardenticatenaceae bacterium]MCB8990941.1 DUF4259 domain-containing protein [Ardenticatenaceae bacterium]MCB9004408.1 DUF4259 domain-containing protein [Ardenticatenaceae bacterium]
MGTWGVGSFENDMALDWLFDFGENDFRLIDRTLAGVAHLTDVDYLDVVEASEALAAAECVAAAGGFPATNIPEDLQDWLDENSPITLKPDYVVMARKATARVQSHSELQELWDDTDETEAWHTAVSDLLHRLSQIPTQTIDSPI